MSRPSFPPRFRDPVPPFAPRGPSGRFPHFLTPTAALRLPNAPAPLALRSARRFCLSTRTSGPPRFLGNPPVHAPLLDPGRISAPGHSGRALLLGEAMMPSASVTASAPAACVFRGSITRPAHLLSTLRSHGYPSPSLRPRKTRFRLVALLGRAGFEPAGFLREVSVMLSRYMPSSSPRLRLAHHRGTEAQRHRGFKSLIFLTSVSSVALWLIF